MLQSGVVINDRYRVVRLLGEGGMGAVYEGEHTGVGRKVAIKVLHPDFTRNKEAVERFEREAQAAAAIGNDHIVDVFDCGRHEGLPYMVMEYLKGESLGQRLEPPGLPPSPQPVGAAVYVLRQVLSALAAAHSAGIIHRDLKPDNVFLIHKGGNADFVKLLDFGVSKFSGTGEGANATGARKSLTQTGALMGTPWYMSPEQALAKREVDQRSDLYAVGVILYQAVVGKVPFDADSQAEILLKVAYGNEPLPPPSQFRTDLPDGFEAVLLKALERDPDKRYQTAEEFSQALLPFEGPPLSVGEATGTYKLRALQTSQAELPVPVTANRSAATIGDAVTTGGNAVQVPMNSSRAPVFAASLLAVVLAGAGVWAALHKNHETESAPVRPETRTVQTTPAVPTTVRFDVEGLPEGAELFIDGTLHQETTVTLPRGGSHSIRVRAPGKLPFETTLVADRDRVVAVALAAEPVAPVVSDAAVATTEADAGTTAEPVRRGRSRRRHNGTQLRIDSRF